MTMDAEQAKNVKDEMCSSFVAKGRLLLTVEVRTPEEAEEILRWMYGLEKPMKSALVEIAWDKATVSIKVAEALESMRIALAA
jgi:hypothetical protein